MIRFVQHEMIDKMQWDNCIHNSINGNATAYSWFLDIVSPGWCGLIEDEYERVFPLPVSSKVGIKYIMQPYFTQQSGLFYCSHSAEDKLTAFLNAIPDEYKYIKINLNTSNQVTDKRFITENTNLELDLISEYSEIASAYQKNLQRNLKKADTNKLSVSKNIRPEEIIQLFKNNKGQELKHLNDFQYNLIQRIAYQSINKGIGQAWGVYDQHNQLIAGALWITSHQKAVFQFSGVSESGKKQYAMPFIIDTFIQQHAGTALTLDFEGSNDPGLARFYTSFGAKRVVYQTYVRSSLPKPMILLLEMWRNIRKQVKKI